MRNRRKRQAAILALAMLGGLVVPAEAGVVLVKSRSAVPWNDAINWAQLGPPLTVVTLPATVTSLGGRKATVNAVNLTANIENLNPMNWSGNFAVGAPIAATGQPGPSSPISITFDTPVAGVGAQMGYNVVSSIPYPFAEIISVYNRAGTLLAVFAERGEEDDFADNSAVFIGVFDSQAEITKVVFSTTTDTGPFPDAFAINNVSLLTPTR
jgi:hypothetical protein